MEMTKGETMKNLLIMLVLFISTIAKADVMDMTPEILVNPKISNTTAYPNIILVTCTFYSRPGLPYIRMESCKKLEENQIFGASGFNYTSEGIFAFPKSLYDSVDMINTLQNHRISIDFDTGDTLDSATTDTLYHKAISFTYSLTKIDDNGTVVYPVESDTRIYKITSVTDDNVTLKLSKRVIKFDDGTQKTITY